MMIMMMMNKYQFTFILIFREYILTAKKLKEMLQKFRNKFMVSLAMSLF